MASLNLHTFRAPATAAGAEGVHVAGFATRCVSGTWFNHQNGRDWTVCLCDPEKLTLAQTAKWGGRWEGRKRGRGEREKEGGSRNSKEVGSRPKGRFQGVQEGPEEGVQKAKGGG